MTVDVKRIGERVEKESPLIQRIRTEMHRIIVGQDALIDGLILALMCNNHVLIEGVPGLAKTLSITTLSRMLQASFKRLQFTPDLLPADVIGTLIYNPRQGFYHQKRAYICEHHSG
jgi:MoxR-like ATPase